MIFKSKNEKPEISSQINLFLYSPNPTVGHSLILAARDINDIQYDLFEFYIKNGKAMIFRHEDLIESKVGIQIDLDSKILIDKHPC